MRRWLLDKSNENTLYGDLGKVRCAAPDILAGKLLAELPEEELTCEGRTTTTTTELEFLTEKVTASPEPDIITGSDQDLRGRSSSSTTPTPPRDARPSSPKSEPYKMDALIIGIVGGVVAFIAIIIICICIVRLRLTDSQYRGGPLAGPTGSPGTRQMHLLEAGTAHLVRCSLPASGQRLPVLPFHARAAAPPPTRTSLGLDVGG